MAAYRLGKDVHQPYIWTVTHPQNLWPKMCPAYKMSRDWGNGQPMTGPTRDHPMGKHQSLTLLMILCCACRQEPSITVLWEAPPSSWLKQMQRPTAKHWMEGLRDLEGKRTSQADQQSQLTWTLGGSQRLNHQLKYIHELDLVLPTPCTPHIYRCTAQSSCWSPGTGGCS